MLTIPQEDRRWIAPKFLATCRSIFAGDLQCEWACKCNEPSAYADDYVPTILVHNVWVEGYSLTEQATNVFSVSERDRLNNITHAR